MANVLIKTEELPEISDCDAIVFCVTDPTRLANPLVPIVYGDVTSTPIPCPSGNGSYQFTVDIPDSLIAGGATLKNCHLRDGYFTGCLAKAIKALFQLGTADFDLTSLLGLVAQQLLIDEDTVNLNQLQTSVIALVNYALENNSQNLTTNVIAEIIAALDTDGDGTADNDGDGDVDGADHSPLGQLICDIARACGGLQAPVFISDPATIGDHDNTSGGTQIVWSGSDNTDPSTATHIWVVYPNGTTVPIEAPVDLSEIIAEINTSDGDVEFGAEENTITNIAPTDLGNQPDDATAAANAPRDGIFCYTDPCGNVRQINVKGGVIANSQGLKFVPVGRIILYNETNSGVGPVTVNIDVSNFATVPCGAIGIQAEVYGAHAYTTGFSGSENTIAISGQAALSFGTSSAVPEDINTNNYEGYSAFIAGTSEVPFYHQTTNSNIFQGAGLLLKGFWIKE